MGKDCFQLGRNIKVRFRAADQRDLAAGQLIVKSRTGKSAAIGGDQQVGMVEIRRYGRNLPELDGPLGKIAGLVRKNLLVVIIEVLPRIKCIFTHGSIILTS